MDTETFWPTPGLLAGEQRRQDADQQVNPTIAFTGQGRVVLMGSVRVESVWCYF
jgi:hypothetical protein